MLTFVKAGDYLINLGAIIYIDLNPEPGVRSIHVFFNAPDQALDGMPAPHIIELTDEDAVTLLRAGAAGTPRVCR